MESSPQTPIDPPHSESKVDVALMTQTDEGGREIDLDCCELEDGTAPLATSTCCDEKNPGLIEERIQSPVELAAIGELRFKVQEAGLLPGLRPEATAEPIDLYLLRFLRARKMGVDAAFEMVRSDYQWRLEEDVAALADQCAGDVLGCEISDIWPYLPCWIQGHDRQERPVIYKEWGNFNMASILEHTTTSQFIRYHVWLNEQTGRVLGQQTIKCGRRTDQCTCVFNAKGFVPSSMRNGAMAFLKLVIDIDQKHYPERLATILVINAPRVITVVWTVVKRLLDPVTRDKVHL